MNFSESPKMLENIFSVLSSYPRWQILLTLCFGLLSLLVVRFLLFREMFFRSLPYPVASTGIPIVGTAIAFGMRGLEFLREQHEKLGNVFLVDLLVLRFHFVLGADAIKKFYKAPNEVSFVFSRYIGA